MQSERNYSGSDGMPLCLSKLMVDYQKLAQQGSNSLFFHSLLRYYVEDQPLFTCNIRWRFSFILLVQWHHNVLWKVQVLWTCGDQKALNRLCHAANKACPWTLAKNYQTFILSKALDVEKYPNFSPSSHLNCISSKPLQSLHLESSHLLDALLMLGCFNSDCFLAPGM